MCMKSLTLYSLPYIVSVASLVVAAHQVAPSLRTFLSDTGTKSSIISGQVVNRSLKNDRLPIKQAVPRADDKAHIVVPAQIAPNQKIKTDCGPPIDVIGRCFAGAGPYHPYVMGSTAA